MAAAAGKPEPLPAKLAAKLEEIRAKRAFDAAAFVDQKVKLFNEYMKSAGLSACVVSLSGGVDSAVTLGLMVRAAAAAGSPIKKVLAVSQPIHSSGWAFARAEECAKKFSADFVKIDQTAIYDQLKGLIDKEIGVEGGAFAGGQLRSYMRTPTAYYTAQLLSQAGTPCVVMGTGNKDEDGYLAYFCKAGDGVVDVQLIADIHKKEVFAVGAHLGVPESILTAPPSADLWDDQSDEEELGFPYDFIELWTNFIALDDAQQAAFKADLDDESRAYLDAKGAKAKQVHVRNAHKLDSPKNLNLPQYE